MSGSSPHSALILASPRDRGAVAAARALNAAGWRVDAGCSEAGGGLLGASRAVQRVHVVPRPRADAREFIDALHAAHAHGRHGLVFGAGDDWLAALSHYRQDLTVRVAHPPAHAVRMSGDKLLLAQWAEDAGLATPETAPATGDVVAGLQPGDFPVVVKNRRHWRPGQHRTHRLETRVCHSREALEGTLAQFSADGDEPILQEHRRGTLGALIGLVHEGRLLGRVQQVSTRLWPTPSGASARAHTVPVDPTLADSAERLLARLGWEGLVELQFLTGEDGVPRLIDFNGRYFGSLALSEKARPGLVDAWARQAAGLEVPLLPDGEAGHRYQWFPGDVRRALVERRGGLITDLAGTLAWGLTAEHSVLRFSDPGPATTLMTGRRGPADRGTEATGPASSASGLPLRPSARYAESV